MDEFQFNQTGTLPDVSTIINGYLSNARALYQKAAQTGSPLDIRAALQTIQQYIAELQKRANAYRADPKSKTGRYNDYLKAIESAIKQLQQYVTQLQRLQQVGNKGEGNNPDMPYADDRTSGWLPTTSNPTPNNAGNIGDILTWLQGIYDKNQGGSALNLGYLDQIIQLLTTLQGQQWQQASDDLAYNRTNYNTLLSMYMQSGMSRAAAMQAAAGSMPSVSGSSVSAMPSGLMQAAGVDMQNAVANRQADIAQQNANTEAFATQNAVWQRQQELINQRYGLQQQYFGVDFQKAGIKAFEPVLNSYYEMIANGTPIPLDATIDMKHFQEYIQGTSDTLSMLETYVEQGILTKEDGAYICDGVVVCSADQYHALESAQKFQYAFDDCYNTAPGFAQLESWFFGPSGPRAYQQNQAQFQFTQNRMYLDKLNTQLEAFETQLASDDISSTAGAYFVNEYYQVNELMRSSYDSILSANGLTIVDGKVGSMTVNDEGEEVFTPANFQQLEDAGLVTCGISRTKRLQAMAELQALLLDTNPDHFAMTLANMLQKDENDNAFLVLQGAGARTASRWIQNTSAWSSLAGVKALFDITGFGAAASGALRLGISGISGASALASTIDNIKHRNDERHSSTEVYDKNGKLQSKTFNIIYNE